MGVLKSEKRVRLPKGGSAMEVLLNKVKCNKGVIGNDGVGDVFSVRRGAFFWGNPEDYDVELADFLDERFKAEFRHFLSFRRVRAHTDEWPKVRDNGGRWSAPGSLQVVVYGRCQLKTGTQLVDLRKGDVFVLNPNRTHEVVSKSLCVTAVADIAWKERTLYL